MDKTCVADEHLIITNERFTATHLTTSGNLSVVDLFLKYTH